MDKVAVKKVAEVAVLVALWYSSAVVCIITSKAAMMMCSVPFVLCTSQFITAAFLSTAIYYYQQLGKKMQQQDKQEISNMVVITSVCYTLGFVLTNIAFSLSNANSVETVKAAEPISSVALGQIFCPEWCSWSTYASLLPIWVGVSLACYGDAVFPFWGVVFAFASNLCFSGRAVAAKMMYLQNTKIDETIMFGQISVIGLVLLIPMALLFDGYTLFTFDWSAAPSPAELLMHGSTTAEAVTTGGGNRFFTFILTLTVNGTAYTLYNLASFLILNRTNLVTHAVLNAFRRVVIIVASASFFSVSLSVFNMYGIALAIAGVMWFAISKTMSSKKGGAEFGLPMYSVADQEERSK